MLKWKLKQALKDMEALAFFLNKSEKCKYSIIFPHKYKSIHNSRLQIVLFVCPHNTNKMFCFLNKENKQTNRVFLILSSNTSQKLNWNSANTCLTDMINIFIDCYKIRLYNESIHMKNVKTHFSFAYVIHKDAFSLKASPMRRYGESGLSNLILFYFILFILFFVLFSFLGRWAKIVLKEIKKTYSCILVSYWKITK